MLCGSWLRETTLGFTFLSSLSLLDNFLLLSFPTSTWTWVSGATASPKVFMYVVKPFFLSKLFQDLEEAETVCEEENELNVVRVRSPHLQVSDVFA